MTLPWLTVHPSKLSHPDMISLNKCLSVLSRQGTPHGEQSTH